VVIQAGTPQYGGIGETDVVLRTETRTEISIVIDFNRLALQPRTNLLFVLAHELGHAFGDFNVYPLTTEPYALESENILRRQTMTFPIRTDHGSYPDRVRRP